MGAIIALIIFGIPSAIIAGNKGFKPFRWLLALGIIGLIVVATMASATAKGISEEEAMARAEKGNSTGAILAWINVALSVIFVIVIFAAISH
ncbi:MAG: hypothetical protein WCL00_00710 [Bacteroidota bacterium]